MERSTGLRAMFISARGFFFACESSMLKNLPAKYLWLIHVKMCLTNGLFTLWTMKSSQGIVKFAIGC